MLRLEQIPMRQDNYSYALIKGGEAIIFDPSEPGESLAWLARHPGVKLLAIINTHSHSDHVGGNDVLWQRFGCPVYGPSMERERIPHLSQPLTDNDEINLLGIQIRAFDVRAHTAGHMAFLVEAPVDEVVKFGHGQKAYQAKDLAGHRVMVVGDSLFAAGCGRLFEGTRENLVDCLSFYARQDPDVLMACAHEYTAANLRFAMEMFPDNRDICARHAQIGGLMAKEGASVPCLFGLEHRTNPFLLALSEPHRGRVASKLGLDSEDLASVIGALRQAKDQF